MMNNWKKMMVAVCIAFALIIIPGMGVTANETDSADVITVEETAEDIVGNSVIQVGNGVTATYDVDTGAVKFTSQDGTLWSNWQGIIRDGIYEINSIEVVSGIIHLPPDSHAIFAGCNMTSLDLSKFDTSNVTNMAYMFKDCVNLTTLDLSGFDTSHVTKMYLMFEFCENLRELNLSGFNTSRITDMTNMFADCSSLTTLDLSSFDTSNVTCMAGMFERCSSLTTLDLSSFDTSNVTNMYLMFNSCSSLTTLDVSSFDTSRVTDVYGLFSYCRNLAILDISSFDISGAEDYSYFFDECNSLYYLKSPKKTSGSIELPAVMYDGTGKEYSELPVTSQSIILTKEKNGYIADISECTITLTPDSYTYTGLACWPAVTVKSGNQVLDTVLTYNIIYSNNKDPGTASVKVTGTGLCTGEKTVSFTIKKLSPVLDFAVIGAVSKYSTDPPFTILLSKSVTDGVISYRSGDSKIAEVDASSGKVTILKPGQVRIYADAKEGKIYLAGSTGYDLVIEASAQATKLFSDVQDPNHAYYKAIYWAANAGIAKGYPDGTFGINKNCTRGEMMMFLWRYAGKPTPKTVSKSPFKDVPKTHTFYKAILWGSQKGITKGYADGTFGINRNVTRGECMMFLWRLKGKPAPKAAAKSPFTDVAKSHAFYSAILWGYQEKITTGYTSGAKKGTFGINENCTRGQIVTFLYRAK